jgi:hypothetical protein
VLGPEDLGEVGQVERVSGSEGVVHGGQYQGSLRKLTSSVCWSQPRSGPGRPSVCTGSCSRTWLSGTGSMRVNVHRFVRSRAQWSRCSISCRRRKNEEMFRSGNCSAAAGNGVRRSPPIGCEPESWREGDQEVVRAIGATPGRCGRLGDYSTTTSCPLRRTPWATYRRRMFVEQQGVCQRLFSEFD